MNFATKGIIGLETFGICQAANKVSLIFTNVFPQNYFSPHQQTQNN